MTDDPILTALAAALLVALLAVAALAARARSGRIAHGRELDALRQHRDGLDTDLRGERDAHGLARGDVARLTAMVEGLEARLVEAAEERRALAARAHEERGAIDAKLDATRAEVERLRVENKGLHTQIEARAEAHDGEVRRLTDLRAEMTDRFKALADETLADHGTRFGTLNAERMTALLKPMSEQVDRFQSELREAHTGAAKDRERLKTEIEQLTRRSEDVSREAVALTRALKGEKQRQGAWGEMILERLLEDSGLEEGREYELQTSVRDDEGALRRPDALVRLPGGKVVVIDAKVSLVAYEAAVNAEDEDERARQSRAHVAAIRAHIDELARRDYGAIVDGAPDYTLMFLPVEGALAAALQSEGTLTAYAIGKRVGIATPTTLMMALRTIQHVWAVETRQRNAEEIASRAGLLHDKMAGVLEAFGRVGTSLDAARKNHDAALDRLSRGGGNVVGQIDKLRRLGARTSKELGIEHDPPRTTPPRTRSAPTGRSGSPGPSACPPGGRPSSAGRRRRARRWCRSRSSSGHAWSRSGCRPEPSAVRPVAASSPPSSWSSSWCAGSP